MDILRHFWYFRLFRLPSPFNGADELSVSPLNRIKPRSFHKFDHSTYELHADCSRLNEVKNQLEINVGEDQVEKKIKSNGIKSSKRRKIVQNQKKNRPKPKEKSSTSTLPKNRSQNFLGEAIRRISATFLIVFQLGRFAQGTFNARLTIMAVAVNGKKQRTK